MENENFDQLIKVRDMRHKEKFFVDDLYLNGYAKFCGPIASAVYMVICRHASKEQECFPSKKTIALKLRISERGVYDGVKKLKEWGIISVSNQKRSINGKYRHSTYTLLDKSGWKKIPSATRADGTKQQAPPAPEASTREQPLPNKGTYYISDTQEKETPIGNNEINQLINVFKESNPTIDFANKAQRKASHELISLFGIEKSIAMAEFAISAQGASYAPVITDPYQLKNKLASLKIFSQKNTNNKLIKTI